MPNSPESVAMLRAAIEAEVRDAALMEKEFETLSQKMNLFQLGQGPSPTVAEFERWRESVEVKIKATQLKHGLPSA